MRNLRPVVTCLLALVFCMSGCVAAPEMQAPANAVERVSSEGYWPIGVALSARQSTTSWDERDPGQRGFELPLLYLHRQRQAAAEADRTLDIHLTGLAAGAEIRVEAQSRHLDVSTGDWHRVARSLVLPDRPCTAQDPCTVHWTFDPAVTYSDFYDLRVRDAAGNLLWARDYPDRPDFVMLDTWDASAGAYTVRVYYATLFPFAQGPNHLGSRLAPAVVTDFVEGALIPLIQDIWHTQFQVWGFGAPLHPDWDADRMVEIVLTDPPFALLGGTGTYTAFAYPDGQPYPQRRLWLFSTNNVFQAYDCLSNGYRALLSHEFFHLAQWNVMLSTGCPANKWLNVFIEAQGRFVPSVQYPELELVDSGVSGCASEFVGVANRFLALRLNDSYAHMEADASNRYDFALYWRFLYEQYGTMDVIRAALEEMACRSDPQIVTSIGPAMDRAFARTAGPFRTFEQSLVAFARANYALRLENGRCAVADLSMCDGRYYDPEGKYVNPPLEAWLEYTGAPRNYAGAIPSSFGMDFIEIVLDPAMQGQPLTVRVQGAGSGARFNVQVWRLGRGAVKPRALTPQPEVVPQQANGTHVYAIPQVDTTVYSGLALIITRLDADEGMDAVGNYTITLDTTGSVQEQVVE